MHPASDETLRLRDEVLIAMDLVIWPTQTDVEQKASGSRRGVEAGSLRAVGSTVEPLEH